MKRLALAIMMLTTLTCQAQKIQGSWSGVLNVGPQKLNVVLHISHDDNGNDVCTMDSPDQGAKGIPAIINHLSADSLSISIPQISMKYEGKLYDNIIKGQFSQGGVKLPLEFKAGIEEKKRPQTPLVPYPYETEEAHFTNTAAQAVFAGTVTYPVGYKEGQRPPVVLLISGSGQQNRDEEIFEHKPFLVIADYLARHGIATLRYDDRGTAQSTGDRSQATTKDYADDAAAGIEWLKNKNTFGKIGILGHSEGSSIAFMLGAQGKADFVISLAGIGVKGDSALTAQVNRINELSGNAVNITIEQYRENIAQLNNSWLNFFIDYDPTNDIQSTSCPVMAINGTKDVQVVAAINLPSIQAKLPGNDKNLIKEYPNLNHLFQSCTTGMVDEYSTIEETINPNVLKDIAEWIGKITPIRD